MLPHRFPRPARLGLYALAAAILLAMCVWPTAQLPATPAGDRIEHTIAWFVLTATGYVLAPNRTFAIPAFALAYGVFIEVVQGLVPTGRHSDGLDFVFDAMGVAIAVVGFLAMRRMARA